MVQHGGHWQKVLPLIVLPLFFVLGRPASGDNSVEYEYRQAASSFERLLQDYQKKKVRGVFIPSCTRFPLSCMTGRRRWIITAGW